MTCVTVSCTVWAEAPGYTALMVIWGGAIGGYCETGSVFIARRPASITMMAITQAKIGLFMKNRGILSPLLLCCCRLCGSGRGRACVAVERHSLYRCSRPGLLDTFEDDTVASLEAVAHQPAVAHG